MFLLFSKTCHKSEATLARFFDFLVKGWGSEDIREALIGYGFELSKILQRAKVPANHGSNEEQ